MNTINQNKYYRWGEWPELPLYKCFWLKTNAKVHTILGVKPNEIIDLKGNYLWEKDVFEKGKIIFKNNFEKKGWFKQFSSLADKLTHGLLKLENSDNLEKIFEQASECLSCSEIINLFDHAFVEYIEENFNDNKQEIFNSIHPRKNTHIMQLQEDIRNKKSLDYLLNNYRWVGTHGFEGEPLSEEKIKYFETKNSFSDSDLKNRSFEELIAIGCELAFYRSYIVETVDKVLFSIIPFLKNKSLNIGLDKLDIFYLSPQEILQYSNLKDEIELRKKSYGAIGNDKGIKILTGKLLQDKFKIYTEEEISNIQEIKGMIAYKGIVQGKAKIILDKKELLHVQDGDILISNETTPEFIVAIKKASAIVTNLGGITSHAAIVAREMNKPCITGTKIATKIFKDGDMVEVDANTGIVRKIN